MSKMKKLELNPNEKKVLELRSEPKVGKSSYGEYFLYIVKNGTGEDYSFFAPNEKVHDALKDLKRGTKFEITKTAKQSGKEIKVDYEVNVLEAKSSELPPPLPIQDDFYYIAMEKSVFDAVKIQNKFPGVCNTNSIAVAIYISRLKQTPSYDG